MSNAQIISCISFAFWLLTLPPFSHCTAPPTLSHFSHFLDIHYFVSIPPLLSYYFLFLVYFLSAKQREWNGQSGEIKGKKEPDEWEGWMDGRSQCIMPFNSGWSTVCTIPSSSMEFYSWAFSWRRRKINIIKKRHTLTMHWLTCSASRRRKKMPNKR